MMKRHILLGSASAIAVGLLAIPAIAQDQMETVVVTGIRASLQSAQAIKQNSNQVVDAIASTDIGALPDRNVAEALQRVPGVTLQRNDAPNDLTRMGSTGNSVYIRGLSWVKSLVNGRDEFTAKNGRSLGFGDVSADLMATVNVYKSTTADQIEGGVGGTVDLLTRKPFDQDGFTIALSADYTYGDLIDKAIPSANFLVSDRWNTGIGEIGALLSVDWQDVTNRTTGINMGASGCFDAASSEKKFYNQKDSGYSSCSSVSSNLLAPNNWGIRQMEFSQQRLASNFVLQWRPSDKLEVTLFAMNTYAHNVDTEHFLSAAISYDQAKAATYSNSGHWLAGDSTMSNIDTRAGAGHNRNTDISLNVKYNPTDNLELTADAQFVESASPYRNMTYYVTGTSMPTLHLDVSSDNPKITSSENAAYAKASNYWYPQAMDHLDYNSAHSLNARFDAKYNFDGNGLFGIIKSVEAGFRTEQKKAVSRSTSYNWAFIQQSWLSASGTLVTLDGTIHCTTAPCSLVSADGNTYTSVTGNLAKVVGASNLYSYQKIFGNSIPSVYAMGKSFASMNTLASWKLMQSYEYALSELPAWAQVPQSSGRWISMAAEHGCTGDDATCLAAYNNTPGANSSGNTSSIQNEQTFAEYFQADFAHDTFLGYDVPVDGNIGVRIVRTEDQIGAGLLVMPFLNSGKCTVGSGSGESVSCTDWQTAYNYLGGSGGQTIVRPAVKNGYTNVLPNFNFRAKLSDTVQTRFAYYETIVRPSFSNTNSSASLTFNFYDSTGNQYGQFKGDPSGYGGNPYLKPMHATNYDGSIEWYFNASGSVTLSLFHKDLSNYVYTATTVMPIAHPVTGKVMDFNYTTYVNGSKGKVEGFEFAYQQFFDNLPGVWGGLGFQANYTKIYNSGGHNAGSDLTNSLALSNAADESLPIEGMSNDSYNLALMYNKYNFDIRMAYNWRSSYLSASSDSNTKLPVWLEDYGQLDGSLFYSFFDHYKAGIQVTNILALPFYTDMGPKSNHPRTNWIQSDRKFSVILRANW